jgi:DNA-binding MarR family transcriptional regulator
MGAERRGSELPFLLLGAFRALVDELHEELATRGHAEARPLHAFALQAVGDGATISDLGRRLGVSKQAAAKTAASLERLGYITREPDPTDGRASRVGRSVRGDELLALSAEAFDRARARLARQLGSERVAELERDLETIVGAPAGSGLSDVPGWLR